MKLASLLAKIRRNLKRRDTTVVRLIDLPRVNDYWTDPRIVRFVAGKAGCDYLYNDMEARFFEHN